MEEATTIREEEETSFEEPSLGGGAVDLPWEEETVGRKRRGTDLEEEPREESGAGDPKVDLILNSVDGTPWGGDLSLGAHRANRDPGGGACHEGLPAPGHCGQDLRGRHAPVDLAEIDERPRKSTGYVKNLPGRSGTANS